MKNILYLFLIIAFLGGDVIIQAQQLAKYRSGVPIG
jgi:hypothetical protein